MKTTFDLPDKLLRRAKAAAAEQGRPLRDLVADALERSLAAEQPAARAARQAQSEWDAFMSRLKREPDGSWFNPEGIDDEGFFDALEAIRHERLAQQSRSERPAAAKPARAAKTPRATRRKTAG